jgi:dihydrofolate reductase
VFILTHHARVPIQMDGGTTFHFATQGIDDALQQARGMANGKDVRIGGGPNIVRQYLRAGLVDELHIAVAPVLLGRGERLFEDVDLRTLGYTCTQSAATEAATHYLLRKE